MAASAFFEGGRPSTGFAADDQRRLGRRYRITIGWAALVVDGLHAHTDDFTSVLIAAGGAWAGWHLIGISGVRAGTVRRPAYRARRHADGTMAW